MQPEPLRVLIVDDEAPARARLRDLLADLAPSLPVTVAGEAANGREALDAVCRLEPDVVLLDIRMPEIDGIEAAEHLLQLERPPAVIFTTAYDNYAVRAFEVNAIDYLLKPVREERLMAALQKAQALTRPRLAALKEAAGHARTHLAITDRGRIVLVPVNEVIYLKAELKYLTVRTRERSHIYDGSLHEFERAQPQRWLRIHRNALVARDRVRALERVHERGGDGNGEVFDGWVVRLDGVPERLQVSRRQLPLVREALLAERVAC